MREPVFSDKGTWGKINSFFGLAVVSDCRLGAFPLAVLYYIVSEYNKIIYSEPTKDCKIPLTFGDLANKGNTNISTMQKAIGALLEEKMIKKVNVPKGRAQTLYIPNVRQLKKLVDDYLERNPNDQV